MSRTVVLKMLIGFGDSQESVDFLLDVDDDWEASEENIAAVYERFNREASLDVEDVECSECGYTLAQCECDEEDAA